MSKRNTRVAKLTSERINRLHAQCVHSARKTIECALAAGDLLIQAKAACGHGNWQAWLAENFDGSDRTARAYMRIAKNRAVVESKMADSAVLSIDGAMRMLAEPKWFDELEAVIDRSLSEALEVHVALHNVACTEGKSIHAVASRYGIETAVIDVFDEFCGSVEGQE